MPEAVPSSAPAADAVAAEYIRRAQRADADAAVLAGLSRRLSYFRLLAAALAAIGLVLMVRGPIGPVAALLAMIAPGVFMALAIRHAGVERRRERAVGHA